VLDGHARPGLVGHVGPTLPGRPSAAVQTASSRFPPAGRRSCLKYEQPLYTEFLSAAPAVGDQVALEDGDG